LSLAKVRTQKVCTAVSDNEANEIEIRNRYILNIQYFLAGKYFWREKIFGGKRFLAGKDFGAKTTGVFQKTQLEKISLI
jgi:hypothetical protein